MSSRANSPVAKPFSFKFCYDVGFVLDAVAPTHLEVVGVPLTREGGGNLIGLNISGLLFRGWMRAT